MTEKYDELSIALKMTSAFRRNAHKVALLVFLLIVSLTLIQLTFQTVFHQRFEIPNSLFFVSVMFLLVLIVQHIVSLRREDQYGTKINDGESIGDLESYLRLNDINRADFLEYSGDHVGAIISFLHNHNPQCHIRILIVDPRQAIMFSFAQAARIVKNYREELRPLSSLQDSKLQVGFYKSPASLRGRNFDDAYLQMSWYTYYEEPESTGTMVRGETNPFFTCYAIIGEGRIMLNFFKQQFGKLWESRTSSKQIDTWIDTTYDDIAKHFNSSTSVCIYSKPHSLLATRSRNLPSRCLVNQRSTD